MNMRTYSQGPVRLCKEAMERGEDLAGIWWRIGERPYVAFVLWMVTH